MGDPLISVVVPFHDNADLLAECLGSVAAQTHHNLQVIMVDDASADDGPRIAAAQSEADARFTLIRVSGRSPGFARNRGIERANGDYLAFVDADDKLPPRALETMLATLERSGSDFVSGNVLRIGTAGTTQSGLHARAIKQRRTGTHITRTPALFYDVSVFNKLFRRRFWDSSGLTFPEGVVWEDIQLMTRAHVLASKVDVITDAVYEWRERDRGKLSITQSRTDIANYRDRIAALLAIDEFLRTRKPGRLLRQHQHKALRNDIWLYIADLPRTSSEYRAEFGALTRRYLDQVGARALRALPSAHKIAYHLASADRMDDLLRLAEFIAELPDRAVPMSRRRGRIRADLPFLAERDARLPARALRPSWRELDPFVRIDSIAWSAGSLVIAGCAFVPSVDIAKRRHTTKIVVLLPRTRLRMPVVTLARSHWHDYATLRSWQIAPGSRRYAYDWAGFRARISPRWFAPLGHWMSGDWDGFILVRAHGVWRPARLHSPAPGPAERPVPRQVGHGLTFGAAWVNRRLRVRVDRARAAVRRAEVVDGRLVIEVDTTITGASPVLSPALGGEPIPLPATGEPGLVRIALDPAVLPLGDAGELEFAARGKPTVPVAFLPGVPELRVTLAEQGSQIAVERTREGNTSVSRTEVRPAITDHAWTADARLVVSGTGAGGGLEAVLARRGSTERVTVAVARDGDGLAGDRFTLTVDGAAVEQFGRPLPLLDGDWDLFLRRDGGEEMVPRYDRARQHGISTAPVTVGRKTYAFSCNGYDPPTLTVCPVLRPAEQGRVQRRLLRGPYYLAQQRRPLRDTIVFISYKGKQCADNPGAIGAELRRRGDDREHVWAVTDWAVPVPDGATAVLVGSEEYYDALARSRWLISNDDSEPSYRKREGQTYVQTWHGTPLKRIGFDHERPQFASGTRYLEHLAADVAGWDLLLSPNPFSTPIMRRAFRFDGRIAETGYPRNDVLLGPEADELARQTRQRLRIPPGKRVVMYAPTWRDNQYYASGKYRFDFRLDLERAWQRLGKDHVILLRGHHQMADDVPAVRRPDFVLDVTRYPDVGDLLVITDAVITDYSSVMFDFAPTGRPLLFFTYDLADYRDNLRGFYFDLEAEAPGPLLSSSDEVIEAVADMDAESSRYEQRYQAFRAKYCPFDDGKAAARACDAIFGAR